MKEETRKEIIELLRDWKKNRKVEAEFMEIEEVELFVEKGIELILRVLLEKEGL
uniref:Uncharacterized protein n=1 Tax=viral metagenome TaxID=1070528 RepID=A0A6H2A133_9ZZZZ